MTSPLPRSTPEEQGIPSAAIADFVATAGKTIENLHSLMLLCHGKVVAEGWWHPWRPESPHMLFSLSKSFTSTAVGMVVSEGRLSLDEPVLAIFPGDAPKNASDNLKAMTVHHLLSMSTGHDQDTTERVFRSRVPVRKFLSLPVEHAPGTHFVYNTTASYVLSAIVQKLTGQTLLEYLTPRLFEPLGIQGAIWEKHPDGVDFGGWGLNIKTEDIARFGQLYLQKGEWNGKQLLPEWWVETATSKQVSNGEDPDSDWAQGYGYQFWRCRHNCYRADGAFGQFCLVFPDQEAVLAITAGVPDLQAVLNLVWEKLLPVMGENPLPVDEAINGSLKQLLKKLVIHPSQGFGLSPLAERISGRSYLFPSNYETLHSLSFDFSMEDGSMTYRLLGGGGRRGFHRLDFGYGRWKEGLVFLGENAPHRVATSGGWMDASTFKLTLCLYETPFIASITCRFEEDKVFYDLKINVGFGPLEKPQLIGTAG